MLYLHLNSSRYASILSFSFMFGETNSRKSRMCSLASQAGSMLQFCFFILVLKSFSPTSSLGEQHPQKYVKQQKKYSPLFFFVLLLLPKGEGNAVTAGLFASYNLGDLNLSHRVVLAPLTRCRAVGGVLSPCHVEYYSQRSTEGGLLITEATAGSAAAAGFPRVAGIHTEEQVEAWKNVVNVVHSKGSIIFCQLWHAGRASHRTYQPGLGAPVSSTNKPISSKWRILLENGTQDMFTDPRALETSEVSSIVEEYRLAAMNSVKAGFDGIEIHGGHVYLIDQFIKESINDRMDEYGGSIENRCRFLMEIIDATMSVVGVNRVGVRISPAFYYNDASESYPLNLGLTIIGRINEFQARVGVKLSYLHVTRPRFLGSLPPDIAGENERKEGRLMRAWRDAYEGKFMASGGFTRETGSKAVADRDADLVSYGRLFISNPDLVKRFKVGATLNAYDRATFYSGDPVVGYTDYPFLCNEISGSH